MTEPVPDVPRSLQLSTLVVLVLSAFASGVGLFVDGFYHRDPAVLLPQSYGQDLLTLAVAVPTLAASLWYASRGSYRGYVAWLGTLGYLLYTYATYAVVARFNELFLVYVVVFGLSLATLVVGLLQVDADAVKRAFDAHRVGPYAAYLLLVAVSVGGLWLSEVVTATRAGTVPTSIVDTGLPTNVVHVLDLGVVLPAFVVAAVLLLRRAPWGYVLAGVLLVKGATLGLAVLSMTLFMRRAGEVVPLPMLVVFGLLSGLGLLAVAGYLRALAPGGPGGAPGDPASRDPARS